MPKPTIFIFCLFTLLVSTLQPVKADSNTTSISQYMLTEEAMMLRGANGEYSISIPISNRIKPQSAILDLMFTNSNVLKANRSQLSVYVNDYVVGQVKLDPINHTTRAKFQIDREYLKQGYNKLTFKAAQHYTDSQCEDWAAPELWTQIDAAKSTFTLNYKNIEVTTKLSALNELINDLVGQYSLTLLRGDTAISDNYLYWGAITSQAVKLRLKYVPLQLEEKTISATGDNSEHFAIAASALTNDAILIGTKAQIAQLIPEKIGKAIQGPYLGIFAQDHDNTHFILVVSGNTDEQVTAAAQSLALLNARFPDQQQSVLQMPVLPSEPSLFAPDTVIPRHTYQFSQLDYQNNLTVSRHATLKLYLPADLYSTEESLVKLNLDLAYGAAMRQDSVINIELNDTFIDAIHLKDPNGAHYWNYQISLPLRSFRAGLNRLQFNAVLTPSESGECRYAQRENLIATIYPDSTIQFPDAGYVAQLPDLKLFARSSFPLAQNTSAKNTAFKLLDTSSDSIAAAWHLIAMMANLQRVPIFDIKITQGDVPVADNIALIGKVSGIARAGKIFDSAPVKLGETNQFPYPYKEEQKMPEQSFPEWLNEILFSDISRPAPVEIDKANVVLTQTGGLGDEFLLMSYPNPVGNGVVLALLGKDGNHLNHGVNLLVSPPLWNQVQGNVFVWDTLKHFQWQQQGDTFTLGEDNLRLTLAMHFSNHPWQWLAVLAVLLLVTAWLTHQMLNKYQRSKH